MRSLKMLSIALYRFDSKINLWGIKWPLGPYYGEEVAFFSSGWIVHHQRTLASISGLNPGPLMDADGTAQTALRAVGPLIPPAPCSPAKARGRRGANRFGKLAHSHVFRRVGEAALPRKAPSSMIGA